MFDFRRLRSPIIHAPMAGGINTPELVAASINAGVVGSFGFAYSSPEQRLQNFLELQKNYS